MTYYHDLAACDYFGMLSTGPLLAVGWLEPEHEYPRGNPGEEFYERLKTLVKAAWQPIIFLGGQHCRFCRYDGFYSHANLFIPGDRVTYVAPEGSLHYVATHDYSPPPEFREAVKNCPPMDTPAYFETLQASGWSKEIAKPDNQKAANEAKIRKQKVIRRAGEALVARVEAYWEEMGYWPRTLQETEILAPSGSAWQYEVTDNTYRLWLAASPDQSFRGLSWSRERKTWISG